MEARNAGDAYVGGVGEGVQSSKPQKVLRVIEDKQLNMSSHDNAVAKRANVIFKCINKSK